MWRLNSIPEGASARVVVGLASMLGSNCTWLQPTKLIGGEVYERKLPGSCQDSTLKLLGSSTPHRVGLLRKGLRGWSLGSGVLDPGGAGGSPGKNCPGRKRSRS